MGRGAPLLIVLLLAVLGGLAWVSLGGLEPATAPTGSGAEQELPGGDRSGPGLDPATEAAADGTARNGQRSPATLAGSDEGSQGAGTDRIAASEPGSEALVPRGPDPRTRPLDRDEVLFYGRMRLAGKPIVGARVALRRGDGVAAEAVTDDAGRFQVVGVQGLEYRLEATAPGIFPTSKPVSVKLAGDRLNLGNLRVWAATWVRLEVETADGAEPLGLEGFSTDRHGNDREPLRRGPDGGLLALAATGGDVLLGAKGYRWDRVSVPSKLEDGLEATLYPGARLQVRVHAPAGAPIVGARIFLVPDHHADDLPRSYSTEPLSSTLIAEPGVLSATTDEDGRASFGELTHGGYVVRAQHHDFLAGQLDFLEPDWSAYERGELDRGEVVGTLLPAPRLYLGLHDADGGVPEGLVVGAYGEQEGTWLELRPDAAGRIERALPHAGDWFVEAWAPGYRLTSQRAVTDFTPDLVEQTLPQPVALRALDGPGVLFVGPDDLPLEEVELTVQVASDMVRDHARDESWTHTWRGPAALALALDEPLDQERLTYAASHEGLLPVTFGSGAWPRRSSGSSDEDPWVLQLLPGLDVDVRVVDGEGAPVERAAVYLTHVEKGFTKSLRTDSQGRCRFTELPIGRVFAKARGPLGGISSQDETDLGPDGPFRLELVID